jgi:hypothetical protein
MPIDNNIHVIEFKVPQWNVASNIDNNYVAFGYVQNDYVE